MTTSQNGTTDVSVPPPHPDAATRPVRALFRERWFSTLFMTDMWERFSFYGMQALLFLYATAPTGEGGLGLADGTAGALFGLYISASFLAAMPGGWLGDRVLGTHRAMLTGALVIAAGHACMAVPTHTTFYLGLLLIACGTGLLKPNLPVMFDQMNPGAGSAQRQAAFSVFYMSVQVSALVGPLVTGTLGERVNWHLGFGAAGVGMVLGVLQYLHGAPTLRGTRTGPARPLPPAALRRLVRGAWVALAGAVLVVTGISLAGGLPLRPVLALCGLASLVAPIWYFRRLLRGAELDAAERERIRGYRRIFVPSVLFWAMYGQLGSVFSLFAREHTDRDIAGFTVPASWFQSAHPLFLLLLAPLFAWLWLRLAARADTVRKFSAGLLCAAGGFAVLAAGAWFADDGGVPVSALWLLGAFLCMTCGELVFGPVGLSTTAESAPEGHGSRMMGLFYLGAALGAGLGGQLSHFVGVVPLWTYLAAFATAATVTALLLFRGTTRGPSRGGSRGAGPEARRRTAQI
ncbi:peptide MFS transporter [Streptomyces turgidiscabies]|uniref:Di-/tripeptide transporter family protein n=1 Tax=Streptomyces turgidiscabies (strain Car8) TaxID=698760 RepID=L7FG95_STRT8|nr:MULTISPECIES: oligopeptide:H+ symporter [Streptomyces]ELP70428.1 di-/tripeptide transporter family protein [Streptomyces turgidiscabies Car8]MDX3494371.1 oligopeptide:H+ symporter [Streptomyces turgidiscabies]GAQ74650.1 di-/tripeptide transporter [Streptomyces turgidiscabies]